MRLGITAIALASIILFAAMSAESARQRAVETTGPSPAASAVSGQAFALAHFTFDDEFGAPDAQGWTSADNTAMPEAYFHVDDFAAVGSPYVPLSGSRSLWCGVYCGSGVGCTYGTPPGYGNQWMQDFTSNSFVVGPGNVTLSYDISYDVEASYDFVRAQYRSKTGQWNSLADYTGAGTASPALVIPGDSLAGSVRVRFRVESDVVFSDQDGNYDSNGAAVIDNVSLAGNGLAEFQDFEAEAVGDTSSLDGHWGAQRADGFGDFAALFDGATVLQEDISYTNATSLWGFFNGSTDDYGCGGHPEQPAVPSSTGDGFEDFINNEIRSPFIDLSVAADGTPVPAADSVAVEFDVYRDMASDNGVFYQVVARFVVSGVAQAWQNTGFIYYGDTTEWIRSGVEFPVPAGATHVQAALGVVDVCRTLCPGTYSGACHSHGPLFDNVSIRAVGNAITVTNTNDAGAGSLRQAILDANASPGTDFIAFDIPGAGPHVIQPLTNLPPVLGRAVIDGYTQSGATPNTNGPGAGNNAQIMVEVDGSLVSEDSGFSLQADSTVVRGIAVNGFPSMGVLVYASDCVIEGCFIGTDATGTVDKGNLVGVRAGDFGSSRTRIGGEDPATRNLISGNDEAGIQLAGGTGHVVTGNIIGLNPSGLTSLGNGNGIHMAGADNSTIGGNSPAARNLISGNNQAGIFFSNNSNNVVVSGNHIGVDVTAIAREGNGTHGVHITASSNTLVGGWNPGQGNLISGNDGNGITDEATATVIVGNVIGGDASGTIAVVNMANGVELTSGSTGAIVGNDSLSGGNRIAFNDGDGVRSLSSHFVISANDMYFNGFQGIDTGDDGIGTVSPDPSFLPFPTLTSAAKPGALTTVTGTVSGPANASLRLEFFADNVICDVSGYGEGRRYLGAANVLTDGDGTAAFSVNVAGANTGEFLTATSTRPDSLTSEFSPCVTVVNTPVGVDIDVTLNESVSATFAMVGIEGQTTLQYTQSCSPLPAGFVFGDSAGCFDIQTTAVWAGDLEVCVAYDDADVEQPENGLRLLHYNDGTLQWEDITATIDTTANLLCGITNHLSPFVVARVDQFTGAGDGSTPSRMALRQNVPNPFNPTTTINYDVPAGGGHVTIRIYDVVGRLVRTLVDRHSPAGTASTTWDGTDSRGNPVSSGVYFYHMASGTFAQTRKMVLLK